MGPEVGRGRRAHIERAFEAPQNLSSSPNGRLLRVTASLPISSPRGPSAGQLNLERERNPHPF